MENTKKNDFVEISFTGYFNGTVFDSNIAEELKKIDPNAKPKKTIVVVGEAMLVPGLDKALEGKEVGKEYNIHLMPKDGFGERDKSLLKTIPLKVFTAQRINPYPGAMLQLDGHLAKVITVSGARVITDFNNPLAGKEIDYKFKIERILTDEKEKAENLIESLFRFKVDFELRGNDLVILGQKGLDVFVNAFKDKVKTIIGKELKFEVKEKNQDKKEPKTAESTSN